MAAVPHDPAERRAAMSRAGPWLAEVSDRTRLLVALAGAAIVPLGVSVALVPARSHAPNATIALALAALVTVLASTGSRLTAAVAAISASAGIDIFYTRRSRSPEPRMSRPPACCSWWAWSSGSWRPATVATATGPPR